MQKTFIPSTFKAVIVLCFFLFQTRLTAQDYKYITAPYDDTQIVIWNNDLLEVNNQYYLLSSTFQKSTDKKMPVITVFDKYLNLVKQFPLGNGNIDFGTGSTIGKGEINFLYRDKYFYVVGKQGVHRLCFAKYNEDFEPTQEVISYDLHSVCKYVLLGKDTIYLEWRIGDVLMTKSNEFLLTLYAYYKENYVECWVHLLRLSNNGELLENIFLPFVPPFMPNTRGQSCMAGSIVETDNYYFVNSDMNGYAVRLSKDSLSESAELLTMDCHSDGSAVAVGNLLIRSSYYSHHTNECKLPDYERSITFFNEEGLKIKKDVDFGNFCANDIWGELDYINPDSIYHVYETLTDSISTISIACFSSEGELHFNHTLWDLSIDGINLTLTKCKALSNGGVLVTGVTSQTGYNVISPGFLLYYHPPQNVGIVETRHATSLPQIFPNPARSQFTVTNVENANLYLYNIVGQEVLQTYSEEENTVVNVNFLPQGVYVLKVVKEGNVSVHKVIVSE